MKANIAGVAAYPKLGAICSDRLRLNMFADDKAIMNESVKVLNRSGASPDAHTAASCPVYLQKMQGHVLETRPKVQARNFTVKAFVVFELLPLQVKHDRLPPNSPIPANIT